MIGNDNKKDDNAVMSHFLISDRGISTIADGVYTVGGQGNSVLVDTDRGLVMTDTGPGGKGTARMIEQVRAFSDKPLLAIVYSHGHLGYNYGAAQWLADAEERGHPAPRVIAQRRLVNRYDRYRETWGLQRHLNGIQFNARMPEAPKPEWFTYPTETFEDHLVIDGGDRRVDVFAAPSETDDATALWIPESRILYAGPGFIKSIPNIGTPLRTLRDPMRWAATMERLLALQPAILIPEFGGPITDEAEVRWAMQLTIDALRYLRRETVKRMNRGMSEWEILHDMEYPPEIFGDRLMKPSYGMPEYIVRDIWRSENGWWDRNPTHLHPADPQAAARARRQAITDPEQVLAHARQHRDNGEPQLALHVLDLLALDPDDDEFNRHARTMKSELLERLAEASSSFVSAQIYRAEAKRKGDVEVAPDNF